MWAQMNVVFGCRAMTRIRCACSSERPGKSLPWKSHSGCSLSSCQRSLCRSSGVKKAPGSPCGSRPAACSGPDLPDRVELRVVDRQEAAVLVADAQAQRLVELQPLGAGLEALGQPRRLAGRPARVVDAGEVDQRVGQEPAGMGLVERGERLLEPRAPAAVEVDRRAHAGRVHLLEVVLHPIGREERLAPAEVVVHVDGGEGRPGDLGHLGHQHRPGLPVAELQLPDVALLLGGRGAEEPSGRRRWRRRATSGADRRMGVPRSRSGVRRPDLPGRARLALSFGEAGRPVKLCGNRIGPAGRPGR